MIKDGACSEMHSMCFTASAPNGCRSHSVTCVSRSMHRFVSFMVLSDLTLQTHVVEEVKYDLQIPHLFDIVQVIIVVSCGSIIALSGAPSVRSTPQLEAISWASARLGLPERPVPITRFDMTHFRLESDFVRFRVSVSLFFVTQCPPFADKPSTLSFS
jgi:hypothetical protein